MFKHEDILYIIENGENSGIEFKEEEVHNDSVAKEIVSFLNFKGGTVLFGVNDDGIIIGIKDRGFEERIMNVFYNKIFPSVISEYEEIKINEKKVAIVKVEIGINKPYYTKINGKNCYFIRYGSTSREASREELLRLFQASGSGHYEVSPVINTTMRDLNQIDMEDYFSKYRNVNLSNFTEEEVENILINSDILTKYDEIAIPSIAGLLLFGKSPKRYIVSAGIRVMAINGTELSDPVIDHKFFEKNVFYNIESTFDYLKLRINEGFVIGDTAKRIDTVDFPLKVLRELLVNAVAHRDYTITGSNIAVILYNNRIEIRSPGSIPNSLTIEKIKQGIMYHRNPVLVQYLYDSGYVERLGRGVRNSIEIMRKYNGTEIEIETDEAETAFSVFKSG